MPINKEDILTLVSKLAGEENLQVPVKNLQVNVSESAKGVICVGTFVFVGSIVGGPVGLLAGGLIGTGIAYLWGRGKYKSVVEIIRDDMTPAQRDKLADSILQVVQNLGVQDFAALLPLVLSNTTAKELVLKEVGRFLQSEMCIAITSS